VSEPIRHERVFELLPWLVNGSLETREREAVEEHLRTCLPCRRELKAQRRLQEVLRTQPAVHISPQTGFDDLNRQMAVGPRGRLNRQSLGPIARFASVATAGVALLAVLLWLAPTERGSDVYRTLAAPAVASGARVDLIFVQSTTAAQMQAVLDELGGEIAAGPTDLGRYTVQLDREASEAEITALLERLRNDPRVRFAGRALAAEGSQ
jgi:putative zinc finger protein